LGPVNPSPPYPSALAACTVSFPFTAGHVLFRNIPFFFPPKLGSGFFLFLFFSCIRCGGMGSQPFNPFLSRDQYCPSFPAILFQKRLLPFSKLNTETRRFFRKLRAFLFLFLSFSPFVVVPLSRGDPFFFRSFFFLFTPRLSEFTLKWSCCVENVLNLPFFGVRRVLPGPG